MKYGITIANIRILYTYYTAPVLN